MVKGIGTDIIEVERIKSAIEKYGSRFLNRIYTEIEQEYCDSFNEQRFVHYAARFAAKESFSKAIGTGITQGFKFKEVGIVNNHSGKPQIILDGDTKEKYGNYKWFVSLSHTESNAVAYVIMEKSNNNEK